MLTVTEEAVVYFEITKTAESSAPDAGIRIGLLRDEMFDDSERPVVGFTISDDPEPDDVEFERNGLRIFVEEVLIEALDGHILDVRYAGGEPELVLR
jgi:Fe-S cluster assembly iron-binding protein IscA